LRIRLSIDRFEGDKNQVAVLLTDDGTQVNFPKALHPRDVKVGVSSMHQSGRRCPFSN
jgi:hypothetical protein